MDTEVGDARKPQPRRATRRVRSSPSLDSLHVTVAVTLLVGFALYAAALTQRHALEWGDGETDRRARAAGGLQLLVALLAMIFTLVAGHLLNAPAALMTAAASVYDADGYPWGFEIAAMKAPRNLQLDEDMRELVSERVPHGKAAIDGALLTAALFMTLAVDTTQPGVAAGLVLVPWAYCVTFVQRHNFATPAAYGLTQMVLLTFMLPMLMFGAWYPCSRLSEAGAECAERSDAAVALACGAGACWALVVHALKARATVGTDGAGDNEEEMALVMITWVQRVSTWAAGFTFLSILVTISTMPSEHAPALVPDDPLAWGAAAALGATTGGGLMMVYAWQPGTVLSAAAIPVALASLMRSYLERGGVAGQAVVVSVCAGMTLAVKAATTWSLSRVVYIPTD